MLIHTIDALLLMRDLFQNKITESPVNRGKSYWTLKLVSELIKTKIEAFQLGFKQSGKDDNYTFWVELLKETAEEIELSSLFFDSDVINTLKNSILAIVFPHPQKMTNGTLLIQHLMDRMTYFRSGKCMDYASLAMYYLAEKNIKPIHSIWLSEKGTYERGHNIVVIGLGLDSDTSPIVFDYWKGSIFELNNAFNDGAPLQDFDSASSIVYYHIKPNENNPFVLSTEQDDELHDITNSLAQLMCEIFNRRKSSGEAVIDITTHLNRPDLNAEAKHNLLDLEDKEREENIRNVFSTLEKYETAAKKIQTAWRFFSQKKSVVFPQNSTHKPMIA